MKKKTTIGSIVRDIKRHTTKRYNAEEKIRIVLEGEKRETLSFRKLQNLNYLYYN